MKHTLTILIALILLTACTSAPTATPLPTVTTLPTALPTATTLPTSTRTNTSVPTATFTPTATPMPAIPPEKVGGLTGVPDFAQDAASKRIAKTAIDKYAKVMGIQSDVVHLNVGAFKDNKGNPFVLAFTADGTPLLIATKSKEGIFAWQEITIRALADSQGMIVTAMFHLQNINDPNYVNNYTNIANQAAFHGEFEFNQVFKNFTDHDWKTILDNWDSIKALLDKGEVPSGFNYNWRFAEQSIAFAKKNGMKIRAGLLLRSHSSDTLDIGNYSNNQLMKIAEFMVKTRVLKYKGQIDEWIGPSEMVACKLYGQGRARFWVDRFGYKPYIQTIQWAFEADPNLVISIAEDLPTEDPDFPPGWKQWILEFLEFLKQVKENIPPEEFRRVRVDIEHNDWIYQWSYDNPDSSVKRVISVLRQITDLGYDLSAPETTVPTSDAWPYWKERPKKPDNIVKDKQKAQAQVYKGFLQAHFALGHKEIGFGGISDNTEWYRYSGRGPANSMILDDRYQPKQAYYAVLQVLLEQLRTNQK
jgi:GH35 family endo-1,4-beta-xylanase